MTNEKNSKIREEVQSIEAFYALNRQMIDALLFMVQDCRLSARQVGISAILQKCLSEIFEMKVS